MEEHALTDKDQYPTEEVIFSHIGKTRVLWESLFADTHKNYPEFDEQWRYYKDGNSWLFKMTRKSKTIFWLSVIKGAFRITFYFGDKAEPAILESTISDNLKEQFRTGKRYNKIRGITISVHGEEDIENIKSLIKIKMSTK